jgi:hypothetical protein
MISGRESCLLLLASTLAACGGKTGSATAGQNGGGTGGTNGGGASGGGTSGGNSDGEFLAQGNFTVSGADSGSASATLAGFQSSLTSGTSDGSEFSLAAVTGDSTSSANFSTPAGIGSYTVTGNFYFPGTPASGMTLTNADTCGSVGFSYGSVSQPFANNFVAASTAGIDCTAASMSSGSWTLTLSSVSAVQNGLGNSYTAHGSLNATMPDGSGDTGTLALTF